MDHVEECLPVTTYCFSEGRVRNDLANAKRMRSPVNHSENAV